MAGRVGEPDGRVRERQRDDGVVVVGCWRAGGSFQNELSVGCQVGERQRWGWRRELTGGTGRPGCGRCSRRCWQPGRYGRVARARSAAGAVCLPRWVSVAGEFRWAGRRRSQRAGGWPGGRRAGMARSYRSA
jgi:hypothetical protein